MFRRPSLPIAVALCITVIALACVPFVLSPYAVKFTTRVLVLAIMVISLDLLIGITGLVSFGHAAFFALGAYAVYFVSPESESANALVVLVAGATLAAAGAFVIGVFAMLTRGFYFIMVTLAAGQMVFSIFYDTDIAKGSDGAYVNVKPDLTIGGSTLLDFDNRRQFFYVCLILLAATYLFLLWLVRSRFGRVLQGIRINEQRMRALGYDTYRYRLAVFVIAGAIAGIAGALFACIDGFVTPELASWRESGLAIMMVVLGGTGTLYGAVIGAFAYSVLEEILKSASMVGPFVAEHWRFGMGVALAAAVLGAPRGLAGLFQSRTWRAPAPIGTDFVHRDFARPERRAHTLSIRDLARHFGGLRAVDGVSLELQANFVHAIIGPNGAGKTTLINLLSGELKPSGGKVYLDELDITGSPPHRIARAGVGRSFQRTNVFGDFTVRDNCALAAESRAGADRKRIAHALDVAGLAHRDDSIAGQLSSGEQRQLEIAMLIASGVDLLLLDEPLAGMGLEETQRVVALLRDLARDHTIVLIEHDMDAVFAAADTLTVLVQGRVLAHGAPSEVRRNPAVREAYLGEQDAA
ncbi:MAG TPA: branched-chain amino acid ABC transporter ATP-binding protein/permease [Beijerinckiaceae bacterium]|jgi:branched-chain amino acid transport system permease protein|nr:branched-chain amino acid ABC transporter ATP-binding protein/permease [Beijerinckiaceae bacterium]